MKRFVHFVKNINQKTLSVLIGLSFLISSAAIADNYKYSDSWGKAGYTLETQGKSIVTVNYSIQEFSLADISVNGETMRHVELPGNLLPNDEGAPDLAGSGRYLAIPQGANATVTIVSYRTETIENVNIAPAPRIPWETETGPLEYNKNMEIYSANKFYPENPVSLSGNDQIRGVDVVMLGITPFQYNPVTKELIVYRDLKVKVEFTGGNGHFGDDRLRSRWWDPLMADMFLNYESLPKMDYNKSHQATEDIGCEYLIVTPTNAEFLQWADSIKAFRTMQGILTDVMTVEDCGGNNVNTLESFFNTAYTTWDIVPGAVLLLGDYGTNSANSIISPIYNSYCASDNIFADVNNNDMPDMVFARMTAQNATHLETMVTKFLDNERTPPTNPDYYQNPITALGFQTERWFQICSESVAGFWEVVHGKTANRINAIYSGSPTTTWSTATNTATVLNVFGPNGLGYIPATPGEVSCTWNGNGQDVINGINSGAFMLQHRDHGSTTGWGEPDFQSSDINSLNNTDLTFVWSINCLTGKFNMSGECFAEKFHRHTSGGNNSGALGINAASEISYSFVNDTYVWGAYDNMWPEFLPDYGTTPDARGILPAFGNAAGKYFLQQSSWPYNTNNKEVTYNLFHHHGDAFMMVYSEIPQNLTVIHNPILYAGVTSFDVTANDGALIALTVNGEIIGTAEGTGGLVSITIPGQQPPNNMVVTITLQNYYRYSEVVEVIPPSGPYVVYNEVEINDAAGNGNGLMETSESILASLTIENVGVEEAINVSVTIQTADPYVTVTDNNEVYGNISAGATAVVTDGFAWDVADNIPDLHQVIFEVNATDVNDTTWTTFFGVVGHGPNLEVGNLTIDDSNGGNGNGRLDPGEDADILIETYNNGSYQAIGAIGTISITSPFITVNNSTFDFNVLGSGSMEEAVFSISIDAGAPIGTVISVEYDVTSGGYSVQESFGTTIGLILEDWETGDMSQYEWETGGNANWSVVNTGAYEGTYCAKSGSINDNQSTYLELEYDVFSDDVISFWFKVSSENNYDYLRFFIDGNEQASWAGEVGWQEAEYAVTGGTHTFKWEYDKDYSVSNGSDCGWVDFIVLPAPQMAALNASFTSDITTVCESETVNFVDASSGGAVSWSWTFEGGTPGTSNIQNPTVAYLTAGTYDVTLEVSDGIETASLTIEDYITVSTAPDVPGAPIGITEVCANWGNSTYTTSGSTGADTYDWILEPSSAGTISGAGTSVIIDWEEGFLGDVTLKVAAENDCGMSAYSSMLDINVYLPEVTLDPFDDVCLTWPAFELTGGMPDGGVYSGPGVDNGWFDPSTAGLGTHTITYTYEDPNSCSNFSEETILVDPCPGIGENIFNQDVLIFPNPNNGSFTLELKLEKNEVVEISIYNALNEVVFGENNVSTKDYSNVIDLSNYAQGIYYLRIKGEETNVVKKIIIRN